MFLPHRLPRIPTRFGQVGGDNVFASRARSTELGIAYNLAVMIFGGFAQLFVTWLIEAKGSSMAPAFYVMFGTAIGAMAAFFSC
jgi:MHS family proline/betaine transporter-like MFS transporter